MTIAEMIELQLDRIEFLQNEIAEERATDMELASAVDSINGLYDLYNKYRVEAEDAALREIEESLLSGAYISGGVQIIEADLQEYEEMSKPIFTLPKQEHTVDSKSESEIIINKALDYYNEAIKKVRNEVFSIRTMSEEEFQKFLIENNL